MTSLTPDLKELKDVQKRISETMYDIDKKNEEEAVLAYAIQGASREEISLMGRSASSVRRNRDVADTEDMNERADYLRQRLFEIEQSKARLWLKIAELQEKEAELKQKLNH
ncbi:hypothetical protein EsDP_00003331 [Epichloe bromicola]|uniref:Uncharacterized protein n=1 Tax=Epichloe bromicola TaxID=79588 RepID=A0ABQ0CNG6_9HYPO